ncbi:MAG: hypothetical protein KTR30_23625 [Saprospiraceae bacterium]|nr:hypothetical protein [Saprospiraceae bacterium]
MKNFLFVFLLVSLFTFDLNAQVEYKIVSVIESIVPAGIGRSRILEATDQTEVEAVTTTRNDGKKSDMSDVKRKDLKIDHFKETKLLNFFTLTGINFQNIASNDALISDKLNQLAEAGWELAFLTSGVESDGGEIDGKGIFITRFVFKRSL